PVGALTENQFNSGGGGGGNGGDGGKGGSGWHGGSGNVDTYPTGGYGGSSFSQRSIQRFVFGGGGGAGSANNSIPSNEYSCSGGSGGGIILARAKKYAGSGSVNADGSNAPGVTSTYTPAQTDAAGGGGAGGTIIMVTSQAGPSGLNSIIASAKGGDGGDMTNYYDYGPGGGGGGGVIISNGAFLLANVANGLNGLTRTGSITGPIDNDYGATPGTPGVNIILAAPPVIRNSNDPSSPCGILPVSLTNFIAKWDQANVDLNWQITNEINLTSFELEYSTDGISFSKLTSVAYHNNVTDYSYVHLTPSVANFYRLKMIDSDGKYFYSKILSVQKNHTGNKIALVYPNPAYNDVTLEINSVHAEKIFVKIIDNAGRSVISKSFNITAGENYLSIDGIDRLPAATYNVRIKSGTINEVLRLIVGKR
nr:T9SS type A sorting domain-containing protein [Bacteroidota bacterium]